MIVPSLLRVANIPSIGEVVAVEHDWARTFVLLPHRTIAKRWVWLKRVYVRRVWVYTGFIDEPETQYAEFFDILRL
jgi:hypothetical protein